MRTSFRFHNPTHRPPSSQPPPADLLFPIRSFSGLPSPSAISYLTTPLAVILSASSVLLFVYSPLHRCTVIRNKYWWSQHSCLEKVVELLDTLGSSMSSLNTSSGFITGIVHRVNKIYVLAFEVANTITKASTLWKSFTDETIRILKEDVLKSDGVRLLVSSDEKELLCIAAADKSAYDSGKLAILSGKANAGKAVERSFLEASISMYSVRFYIMCGSETRLRLTTLAEL